MESVNCSCCGSADSQIVFVGRDLLHGLPGKFPLRRCKDCGLFYLSPRPDRNEIAHYYPEDYWPHNIVAVADRPGPLERLSWQRATAKRLQAVLPHAGERGKALDVGCATGSFLDSLHHLGWQPFGVEPNEKAAAYARARFGLDVFCGELEQACYPSSFFDLVTLWDVLEHLHDPRGTLLEVARVTKSGGALVMNIPNPDGIEARLFGPYWAGWDVPRHLNMFPLATLWSLLEEVGFSRGGVSYTVHNTAGLPLSLEYWLAAHVGHITLRRLVTGLVSSWLVHLALMPYSRLLSKSGRASFMTVIMRRSDG
jgi:SAM-dependent methyltransferase